jgi:hypothetical protein
VDVHDVERAGTYDVARARDRRGPRPLPRPPVASERRHDLDVVTRHPLAGGEAIDVDLDTADTWQRDVGHVGDAHTGIIFGTV